MTEDDDPDDLEGETLENDAEALEAEAGSIVLEG